MDLLVTSKYVTHRDTIGYLGSNQQGDKINKTTFDVYACRGDGFRVCRNSEDLARNILTRHCVGSFILQRNSVYHVAHLPSTKICHLEKIRKIQWTAGLHVCTHTSN
jgi:hypothetical protein